MVLNMANNRLKDCFTQVPFQQSQAVSTLDALDSLTDLYSFTDLAVNSGAPYNIKVDLRGGLASIRSKVSSGAYSNDYAFQTDIMNLMNPLFDAHTLYRAPGGYQCFFLRPFNIEAAVVSGELQFTLRTGPLGDSTNQIWSSVFNFNPAAYVDKVVTSINGKPVSQHVDTVARNFVSTYKDQGVRFNAALRGRWAQTVLSMFPITDPNFDFTSTYVMADGSSVTVPNAGFCNPGIDSTSGLLGRNKGGALTAKDFEVDPMILVRGIDIHKEQEQMLEDAIKALPAEMLKKNKEAAERVSRLPARPSINGETITIHDLTAVHAALGKEFNDLTKFDIPRRHFPASFDASSLKLISASRANDTYYMKYNDGTNPPIWIYKLLSFAPSDVAETLNILNTLLKDAQANNGQHIIADVANNGGGIICLSDLILALLVPEWESLQPGIRKPGSTPYGIYDYKASKAALAIRANSNLNSLFTSYQAYLDRQTEKPVTADFYGPVARTRAGITSNYTNQALFPSQCVGYPRTSFTPVKYYFKHITVLTDGTCGSACALFASQLQSNGHAKVVSYGGPLHRTEPLSTASFAGGNVLDYGTVAMYSYLYGGSSPGLPPRMTSSALARFNFNEYYEENDLNTPREFLKRPAEHHIDFYATMFANNPLTPLGLANNAALYKAVAGTF